MAENLFIGDTWSWLITATDSLGVPLDLTATGLTPSADYWSIGQSEIPLTVGNGITVTDPTHGKFLILIDKIITVAAIVQKTTIAAFGTRVRVKLTDVAGDQQTIGMIDIIPVNTRPI